MIMARVVSRESFFSESSTMLLDSESRAEVGSSHSSTAGSLTRARTMATRCFLAAGKLQRAQMHAFGEAESVERVLGALAQAGWNTAALYAACNNNVFHHAQCGQQFSQLKHKAVVVQPDGCQAALGNAADRFAADGDYAFRGLEYQAHDGQQRCFAAARRAGQNGKLARINIQIGFFKYPARERPS